jgi:hypothetical protein
MRANLFIVFLIPSNFNNTKPNIFVFLNVLKNMQINTYIKINSVHLECKIKSSAYRKRNIQGGASYTRTQKIPTSN